MGFYTRLHRRHIRTLGGSLRRRTLRLMGLVLFASLAAAAAPATAGELVCEGPEDCPPASSECLMSDCIDGMCVETFLQPGTMCTDTDGMECTAAECDGEGTCDQTVPVTMGTACTDTDPSDCTTAACDGAGMCDQMAGPFVPSGSMCTDTDENVCTLAECDGAGTCEQAAAAACDFGDDPDSYLTTLASGGAHHLAAGPMLGAARDAEPDANTPLDGTGDDVTAVDDEDGVTFPNALVVGEATTVSVTASAAGTLDYFFDFDGNGSFGPGEIFVFAHPGGTASVPVTVPVGAALGSTFARFRLSSSGVMGPGGGPANDGEVEDYAVTVSPSADLGITKSDSPDPVIAGNNLTYTLTVSNLGPSDDAATVTVTDTLPAGVTFVSATGTGWMCGAAMGVVTCTRSGLTMAGSPAPAITVEVTVNTATTGPLTNNASVSSPTTDLNGKNDSIAVNTTVQSLDFGDAPDPRFATAGEYPTLLSNDGARHELGSGLFLGAGVDADPDGHQNADATGDDVDSDGDNGDDEDGVMFKTALIRGGTTEITVVASGPGVLNAWVDFNADGTWDDPGEHIFADTSVSAGPNALSFAVPADPVLGPTFARFRLTSLGAGLSGGDSGTVSVIGPAGFAFDGEVEDYQVDVVRPGIGDTVWCDDGTVNGAFDAGEGLPDITVNLLSDNDCSNTVDEGDPVLATTSTVMDGFYSFEEISASDLPLGTVSAPVCYRVSVDTTDPQLGACAVAITPTRYFPNLTDVEPRSLVNDFGFVEAAASSTFSKSFNPGTIGQGGTSTLEFVLTNTGIAPLAALAFTDDLSLINILIATPSSAMTDCTNGVVNAPDGGTLISFSGGDLGPGSACTVRVNVTSSTVGTHTNVSSSLSSSVGSDPGATADLVVDGERPGFSKSFTPSTIPVGGTSTLEIAISSGIGHSSLNFTDIFPAGMVFATPANVSNTCGGTLVLGSGADPDNAISLIEGSIGAESTCTVAVDVTTDTTGVFVNTTSELLSGSGSPVSSGFATAALDVATLFLEKLFTDDPVAPGGTVTLQFTINNPSRDFPATAISFNDDLDPLGSLTGLAPSGALPASPCGAGSSLAFAAGTGVLSLTGGSLAAEGSCTFSLSLGVPGSANDGAYTNTTSAITATIGGEAVVGNKATDRLFVSELPILTKEFIDDPVGAGGSVTLRFTITNPSADALSDLEFTDDLNTAIPGLAANGLVDATGLDPAPLVDPCGSGSELTVFDLNDSSPSPPFPNFPPDATMLIFTGGSLAAGGSCTFDVVLDVPGGVAAGTYTNTTSEITGTASGAGDRTSALELIGQPVTGPAASGDLVIVGAPRLTKDFTDDPALPGGTVTLEFSIEHDLEAPSDATAIAFTDDLVGTTGLAGLSANDLPKADVCGTGSLISGTTNLTFTGGTLTPGEICTFSVTLDVPAAASPGSYQNETSNVVATVGGVDTVGNKAQAELAVGGLTLTKEFTDDPVIAGGTVTLEFVITNQSPNPVSDIFFEDVLDPDVVLGLAPGGALPATPCGAGSALSFGAGVLMFSGGSLPPTGGPEGSDSCSFSVPLLVPPATPSGTYPNRTRLFSAVIGEPPMAPVEPGVRGADSSAMFFPNATDNLVVANEDLLLTKDFTDDPVAPGGTVTLEFSLSSLSSETATGLAFTDDLGAALAGLAAVPPLDSGTCGGTLSGTSVLSFSGGSFTSGECSFSVTVQVPAAVPFGTTITNTTSMLTGMIDGLAVTGEPASDDLLIDFFNFTKFFDGLTKPTGTPVLTFTIENLSTMDSVADLAFLDNLDDVIPGLTATGQPANPCGPGSVISGTSVLTFSGGNLLPGGSCTFAVNLLVPGGSGGGTFLNTTSELSQAGLPVSSPATALLEVDPPPSLFKVFLPDFIAPGGRSALTFLIDNSASVFAVTGLSITDNLPPGMTVATSPDIGTDCAGATLGAVTGSNVVSVSGGQLPAGDDCVVQVDVTASVPGSYINTTGPMTSSSGTSAAASDTLVVVMPGGMCPAPDGDNLTLQDDTVMSAEEFVVCDTITVGPNYGVVGPDGDLLLRAGVAVVFRDGFSIFPDGQLTVRLEPVLKP